MRLFFQPICSGNFLCLRKNWSVDGQNIMFHAEFCKCPTPRRSIPFSFGLEKLFFTIYVRRDGHSLSSLQYPPLGDAFAPGSKLARKSWPTSSFFESLTSLCAKKEGSLNYWLSITLQLLRSKSASIGLYVTDSSRPQSHMT